MTPATPTLLKIDFVSDIVCPWCAIGLAALAQAAERLAGQVRLDWHFQPFELNPGMGPEGEDLFEHLAAKYGSTPEQLRQMHAQIGARGAALGFTFSERRTRIYNTFDAHRLLHWAGLEGPQRQLALKHALLRAYFTDGEDVSSVDTLARLAVEVGLEDARARQILASDEFAETVRQQESFYASQGITAVPSVIFNDRHLIQGGQPVELFEQALRQLSGISAPGTA